MLVLLALSTPALSAPPPELRVALAKWAAPASISRYQFSMADLNGDERLDAVVLVTDPARCGNGGCPLLVFQGTVGGYEKIADSGFVRKPIYLLKEINFGWHSLAGVVGLGEGAVVRPIHYKGTEYRSTPYLRAEMQLSSQNYERALEFEEAQ